MKIASKVATKIALKKAHKTTRLASFLLVCAAIVLQAGAAHAAIKTQWIDYKQGNTPLSGYLIYDDAVQGRRPGILMIHDRSGFSEGTLADAQTIANLGYVVFAEDMFGKGIVPKDVPEMTKLIGIYDSDRPLMRARAMAGFNVLKAQSMVDPSQAGRHRLLLRRHHRHRAHRNGRAARRLHLRARRLQ